MSAPVVSTGVNIDMALQMPVFDMRVDELQNAVIELRKRLADAQPKWIPVSEREPERVGYYFASWPVSDGVRDMGIAYFYPEFGPRWSCRGDDKPVTHWMLLPAPPKEGA